MARISCVVPVVNNSVNVSSLSLSLWLRISVCFRDCLRHELDALTSSGVRYTVSTPMQRRDPAHSTIIPPGCTRCFEFSRIESIRVFISNLSMHVCALSKDPFVSINYVFFRLFKLYIQNEKINAWFYIRKNRSKKENDIFLRLCFQIN